MISDFGAGHMHVQSLPHQGHLERWHVWQGRQHDGGGYHMHEADIFQSYPAR